ncbi:hypothetical protein TWF706_001118 [Orbilia oligospora]|nr:hypothetical protein TWF706_001118 [Orbilia oligospora]
MHSPEMRHLESHVNVGIPVHMEWSTHRNNHEDTFFLLESFLISGSSRNKTAAADPYWNSSLSLEAKEEGRRLDKKRVYKVYKAKKLTNHLALQVNSDFKQVDYIGHGATMQIYTRFVLD